MKKINIEVSFRDKRGKITDLTENQNFNAATIVTFKKNSVRGNHYHKKTVQWNYLLSGKIKILSRIPGKKVVQAVMKQGEMYVIGPNEHHSLTALKKSELLVLTKGPRGGKEYETDTYRLKTPLEAL